MVTIKQTTDILGAEKFLKSIGSEDMLGQEIVMELSHKSEIYGIGTLSLENGRVCLNRLVFAEEYNDTRNKLSLAKALLNFADFREIKFVYGTNPELNDIYQALRFQQTKDGFQLKLEGYFSVRC